MSTTQRTAISLSEGASKLLSILRDGIPRTRAELVERTGAVRSTVGMRIDEAAALGLVEELAEPVYTGGRPTTRVRFVPSARLVVGIDIGVEHTAFAIADLRGETVTARRHQRDPAETPEAALERVLDGIYAAADSEGLDRALIAGVGIGISAPVEHRTGRPIKPMLLPGWDGFDMPRWFLDHAGLPAWVEKDAHMMAVGERSLASAPEPNMLFVKVAAGIGGGIIINGQVYRGTDGTAGVIGHIPVRGYDTPCHCGNRGCLEAVAAGPALARELRDRGVPAEKGRDVVRLAQAGNISAVDVVRQAGRNIGEILSICANVFNPALIVIGGEIAQAGDPLLAGIREVVYGTSMPLATRSLEIQLSDPEIDVAVRGAAVVAADHVLGEQWL